MKKLFIAFLFLPLFVGKSISFEKPRGFVSDQAHLLDLKTEQALASLLEELEQKTSAEMAVVTVASLDGRDINEYSNELFKSWGIGKRDKNNGLLFLIAPNERKARIEVGYGLEGILPDARTGRIQDEFVVPYFKEGRYSDGIYLGTWQLASIIAEDNHVQLTSNPHGIKSPRRSGNRVQISNGMFLLIFILYLIFLFIRRIFGGGSYIDFGGGSGGFGGGGYGGGGFGGFGGGSSGGGGSSRSW